MRIRSVTIQNFRCFGPEPTTLKLDDLTAIVGANGSGKSAVLQGLARVFGTTSAERTLEREDFHVPMGKTLDELGNSSLVIEVRLDFPELDTVTDGDGDNEDIAVGDCFSHMVADAEGEAPYCRIRLEGFWTPGSLPEGNIDQDVYWVTCGDEQPDDADKKPMRAADRARIQVHYVPASRDPARHVRHVSGSLLHHLLRAVQWSEDVQKQVEQGSEAIKEQFEGEDGVRALEKALQTKWSALHPAGVLGKIAVRPMARRFDEILKRVEAVFTPGPGGGEYSIDRLSDGLKSLFYLSIVAAAFQLYEEAHAASAKGEDDDESPFLLDELDPPVLSVFAIEEPENHLAPHYLGRIMGLLRQMSITAHGQVLLTSHSASILKRVEPDEVRYLRLDPATATTRAKEIVLPQKESDAHKFVREAVRIYPELYFARLVVLGEGDSEEVVIPKLCEAFDLPTDPSFVSMVPLGGRHVNHLWRLLDTLEIPYVTLLDLDVGREGGGWGRIKYACKQLIANNANKKKLLSLEGGAVLSDGELEGMHEWDLANAADLKLAMSWVARLEQYDVFFSEPLDLDWLMLKGLTKAYQKTAPRGPSIPDKAKETKAYNDELNVVMSAVFKKNNKVGELYEEKDFELLYWYRTLFLSRDKPTTHILALAELKEDILKANTPKPLVRLIKKMKAKLLAAESEDGDVVPDKA